MKDLVQSTTLTRSEHMVWKALMHGWIKLNTDAFVNIDLKDAVIGGLIQDSSGLCFAAFIANVVFCAPSFAKIWAIQHGLKWLLSLKLDNVVVEIDSKLAL